MSVFCCVLSHGERLDTTTADRPLTPTVQNLPDNRSSLSLISRSATPHPVRWIRGKEEFFSIVGAAHSLDARTDLHPANLAGVVVNPVESSYFDNLDTEIRDLLSVSGSATGTRFEVLDDDFGTRWVVLDDPDFEDLVTTIHTITETVIDHGFADRLLASAFKFEFQRRPAYWLYNYKQGRFYPFVPTASRERDYATEMRLGEIMREERIPVEGRLERWYAL